MNLTTLEHVPCATCHSASIENLKSMRKWNNVIRLARKPESKNKSILMIQIQQIAVYLRIIQWHLPISIYNQSFYKWITNNRINSQFFARKKSHSSSYIFTLWRSRLQTAWAGIDSIILFLIKNARNRKWISNFIESRDIS